MLTPKQKKLPALSNLFAPRSPLEFLGFSIISAIVSLLSAGNPIGFIGVSGLAMFWWWVDRQRTKKASEELVFSLHKEPPHGAKGLILLLSPYSPRNPALQDLQKIKPLIEYLIATPIVNLETADFDKIGLFNSNLCPQIKAVEYHFQQGKLQEVWLISSESYDTVKGSESTAQILQQYLRFHYGQKLNVHWNESLSSKDYEYKKLWQIGEDIFRQSGYKDEVLVADITGGTKMMSVALALACIPPKRRMQYMDSQRDWQGNPLPQGEMSPVVIDVDPILYQ